MSAMNSHLIVLGAVLMLLQTGCVTQQRISYQRDVVPIIETKCLPCHMPPGGAGYQRNLLNMDSYDLIMEGNVYGPVIVPGDSRHSILNMLVEGRVDISMHTPHPLSAEEIKTLRLWVDQGAMNN
jgi:hypothetical protein